MKFPQIGLVAKPIKHQVTATGFIEESLKRAGYRTRATLDLKASESIIFCWSWGKAETIRLGNKNAIICCLDHGYTRERGKFINTGWSVPSVPCGLNGFAEHAWVEDGGGRLRAMGWDAELLLFPPAFKFHPQSQGLRALICGQVYGDAMVVDHVADYTVWLHNLKDALQKEGYETRFRPHPVMVRRGNARERYGNMGRESQAKDLWEDFRVADLVVGLSSNAVAQGFMAGVDARVYNKGSMLSPLVTEFGHNIPREGRAEWAHRLAWTQWTEDELRDGTWARHHIPIMHRLVEGGELRPWCERKLP